jgi:hypothetical protein
VTRAKTAAAKSEHVSAVMMSLSENPQVAEEPTTRESSSANEFRRNKLLRRAMPAVTSTAGESKTRAGVRPPGRVGRDHRWRVHELMTKRFSMQLYSARLHPPLDKTLALLSRLGYAEIEGFGNVYGDVAAVRTKMDRNRLSMPTG